MKAAIPTATASVIDTRIPARYRRPARAIIREIVRRRLSISVQSLLAVLAAKAPMLRPTTFCEYRLTASLVAKQLGWKSSEIDIAKQHDFLNEEQRLPRKKRKHRISNARLQHLISVAAKQGYKPLAGALVVAWLFGVRLAELPRLQFIELNGKHFLDVHGAKRTESRGSDRKILVPEDTVQVLNVAVRLLQESKTERLRKRLYLLDAAEFPREKQRVTFHRIRHKVSSDLKASGVTLNRIAALLGHRSEKSTEHYGDCRLGERRKPPGDVYPEFEPRPYEPHPGRRRVKHTGPTLKPK